MIRATITEIYDMNTHIGEMGLIGIHTPRYDLLFRHLFGHFVQFKRWKYDGASISVLPAAGLPQDVAGVSLEAGDHQVDPRDIFNPILHKGFTGESLGAFLDNYLTPSFTRGDSIDYSFYSDTTDDTAQKPDVHTAYYQMLTQGGFKKMMPMQAITNKFVYPMVYDLATTRQLSGSSGRSWLTDNLIGNPLNDVLGSVGGLNDYSDTISPTAKFDDGSFTIGEDFGLNQASGYSSESIPVLTPRKRKLGWMDTLQKVYPEPVNTGDPTSDNSSTGYTFAQLPKLMEYLFVTPPSYYSKLYYRMIIRHHVSFTGLRSAVGASNALASLQANYWNYMEQLPSTTAVSETGVVDSGSIDTLGADAVRIAEGMH